MEDSIMSVHMDCKNQRQIYISITDFSLKNTLSKKKKTTGNNRRNSDRNFNIMLKIQGKV